MQAGFSRRAGTGVSLSPSQIPLSGTGVSFEEMESMGDDYSASDDFLEMDRKGFEELAQCGITSHDFSARNLCALNVECDVTESIILSDGTVGSRYAREDRKRSGTKCFCDRIKRSLFWFHVVECSTQDSSVR